MAVVETFRYIEYSDESKFTKIDDTGRIELKEYSDDLVFYTSFDSTFNAVFSKGDPNATIIGTTSNENSGVFGQYGFLQNGSVEWNSNNFIDLADEGCIKFRLRPEFNNAPGRQDFIRTTDPIITAVPDIDTIAGNHLFGGAALNLTGNEEKRVEYNINNISGMIQTGTIDFMVKFNYTGFPSTNIGLIDIKNVADNNNRIVITHEIDGNLYFRIYNQIGVEIVNISFAWVADLEWHNFEFNFDINVGETRAFIDGTQYGPTDISTGTRVNVTGFIAIGSVATNISNMFIDDLAFFSTVQHTTNFSVRTIAHTGSESNLILYAPYDTSLNLIVGVGTLTYSYTTPANSNYELKLTVDGVLFGGGDTIVTLESSDTINDIRNKLEVAIAGSGAETEILVTGNIRIKSNLDGATILIEDPDTGRSLISLLDGVEDPEMPNAPIADVNIFDFFSSDNNRITLIHNTESHFIIKMYNSSGILIVNQDMGLWNNFNTTWYAIEFNWNKTIAQFYIDGILFDVFSTGFIRGGETKLKISSGTVDFYRFDELIIYNEYQHNQNYTIETLALSKYSADDPYIDIHFGSGFNNSEVTDLNLNCSSDCNFVTKLANTWYYYLSGAWRQSNGTYSQSNDPATMETKFAGLFFDENHNLIIRVYFHSDGSTLVWLEEISITVETSDSTAATITGTVAITGTVDVSVDSHIIITTDQGTLEVDVSTAAIDPANATLDEIKQAIDDANVPGLAPASDDGNGHLVLLTENTGTDAYISITNGSTSDALPIIWGFEATDSGEEPTGTYFDYSGLIDWIRTKLGAPIAPVELTDEQIESCIGSAVFWYNYYRNAKENVITVNLNGNAHEGWEIPEEVGGEDNIIEIIVKPRFPYTYYIGREDLMGNLYMQYFFHKYRSGYKDLAGDYYITISTEKDLGIILGTYLKWEYLNGRLFIHPEPPQSMLVGIKFRSAVSIDEINTNYFIRQYALGSSMEILGRIRGTFGGTMPGGTEMLTLRGTELIEEGKAKKEKIREDLIKLSEPLGFDFG